MGVITERKRRNYSGLDADKALIPAASKSIGDTYFATDTKISYTWDGSAWIPFVPAGLLIPRSPVAWDKVVGDFVTDGTWKANGLNLSGIVPVGAVAILLHLQLMDDAAGSSFGIRKDATGDMAGAINVTQVANLYLDFHLIIPCDTDRLLDYYGSNLTFSVIDLAVIGWFI